jgi:hypothetical protein
MKLLHFDDFRLGVLKGDAVVDVSAEVSDIPHAGPGDLLNGLIERWDSYRPRLEAAVAHGPGVPVSSVRIRPPVPGPRTIDCRLRPSKARPRSRSSSAGRATGSAKPRR